MFPIIVFYLFTHILNEFLSVLVEALVEEGVPMKNPPPCRRRWLSKDSWHSTSTAAGTTIPRPASCPHPPPLSTTTHRTAHSCCPLSAGERSCSTGTAALHLTNQVRGRLHEAGKRSSLKQLHGLVVPARPKLVATSTVDLPLEILPSWNWNLWSWHTCHQHPHLLWETCTADLENFDERKTIHTFF